MPNKLNGTKEMVNVLLVAPTKPLIGGQSIQAERLEMGMKNDPFVSMHVLSMNPRFFPTLQKIPILRTFLTSSRYWFELLRGVPRADVLHVFSASYYSFIISPAPAVLIGKFFRKKVILHYHSGEADDHLENWQISTKAVLKRVDKIAVPSGFLVEIFEKHGFKAESIPNIIEAELFLFRNREELRPIFLSNRNLEAIYNVECIIRAFSLISEKYPNGKLIIAGDGQESDRLRKIVTELNLDNVLFAGSVSQDQMAELYHHSDIYLNASNVDNQPNSIIEAFSAGLPVISTNAGGIPFILEHEKTGILVEKNDCRAIADAALRLLDDPVFAGEIANGARKEVCKYTPGRVKAEWREIYHSLVGLQLQETKN